MSTYHGAESATPKLVRRYLDENWAEADGETPLSDQRITDLMAAHAEEINRGERLGSFAGYVGDSIARAESLMWIGKEDEDPDDEDS